MTNQQIRDQLYRIISKKLDITKTDIKEWSSFTDDLGADSLDVVELAMECEKAFGIKLPDEETEKVKTVADALSQ